MEGSRLPKTDCNVPMPSVRNYPDSHWCDTCCKSDVCMYRENTIHVIEEVNAMTKVDGVFLNIEPSCKKWAKTMSVSR